MIDLSVSFYSPIFTTLLTLSNNLVMSPSPNNLLMNDEASNYSKSSKCSPKPIKVMGDSVAATADNAPPPLAWPSNLVMITDPTLTALRKARA